MNLLLEANYDARASFYGKARVEVKEDGSKVLTSYTTEVAEIKGDVAKVYGLHSATTLRHIKEFLKQNGFEAENKKQIWKDYGVKEWNRY